MGNELRGAAAFRGRGQPYTGFPTVLTLPSRVFLHALDTGEQQRVFKIRIWERRRREVHGDACHVGREQIACNSYSGG